MSRQPFITAHCWECDHPLAVAETEAGIYRLVQCLVCGSFEYVKADLDPVTIVNRLRRRGPMTITEIQLRHGGWGALGYKVCDE